MHLVNVGDDDLLAWVQLQWCAWRRVLADVGREGRTRGQHGRVVVDVIHGYGHCCRGSELTVLGILSVLFCGLHKACSGLCMPCVVLRCLNKTVNSWSWSKACLLESKLLTFAFFEKHRPLSLKKKVLTHCFLQTKAYGCQNKVSNQRNRILKPTNEYWTEKR